MEENLNIFDYPEFQDKILTRDVQKAKRSLKPLVFVILSSALIVLLLSWAKSVKKNEIVEEESDV